MKAEEFIELIEQKRFDKISRNGMDLIAKEFRRLQSKPLIIDSVSHQREQLINFLQWLNSDKTDNLQSNSMEGIVDAYIKIN